MKIRNGFVSNSSSSSFIIALKKINVPCPHCGRKDPDFLDMIEKSSYHNDDNSVFTRETKETLVRISEEKERWCWPEDEYKIIEKRMTEYKDDKGWVIAYVSLSNHDENLKSIMYNMIQSGNANLLWESEG